MVDHVKHPCPSCGQDAPRAWEETFSFGFSESKTAAPANTGVHKEDYPTADHLIGKDADTRWAMLNEREKVKNAAREKGGTHALIRHNSREYIDYEPMSETGLDARRRLAKAAIDAVRAQKTK